MSELKPCPFCGGEAVFNQYAQGAVTGYVLCRNCHSAGAVSHVSKDHAFRLWNTRTNTKAIEALRKIVLNAVVGPDTAMDGATDCYHVPIDDVELAQQALSDIEEG